jgi:hypothetical protein
MQPYNGSEKFKTCMDMLISHLQKKSNIVDLKYFDGYYIFLTGENSIAHFHFPECPGWLFGIWLAPEDDSDAVSFSFFAQYEEFIDKFKPAQSALCVTDKIYTSYRANSFINSSSFTACDDLVTYIRREPALAFCRDQFCYDYNTEYLSREDAETQFHSFVEDIHHANSVESELNSCLLQYYREHVLPLFRGSKIVDRGKNHYPQYAVTAPMSMLEIPIKEPGYYSLSDCNPEVTAELDRYIDELSAKADAEDLIWTQCIDKVLIVYDDLEA